MKTFALVTLALFGSWMWIEPGDESQAATREADTEAVRAAVLDYVEAIYEIDPSRIERSVDPALKKFGYYDIFLIDPQSGHIVYSVFKELDYATSLSSGPYRNTNFAQAFSASAAASDCSAARMLSTAMFSSNLAPDTASSRAASRFSSCCV